MCCNALVFRQVLSFSLPSDQQDNDCAAYNVPIHVSSLGLPGTATQSEIDFNFPLCFLFHLMSGYVMYHSKWVIFCWYVGYVIFLLVWVGGLHRYCSCKRRCKQSLLCFLAPPALSWFGRPILTAHAVKRASCLSDTPSCVTISEEYMEECSAVCQAFTCAVVHIVAPQ